MQQGHTHTHAYNNVRLLYTAAVCVCSVSVIHNKNCSKELHYKKRRLWFPRIVQILWGCASVCVSVCVWRALNRFSFAFILYIVVVFVAVLLFFAQPLMRFVRLHATLTVVHTHTAMHACTCVCVHSPSEGQRCFLPLVMGCCANIIRVFFLFYFLFLWPLEKSN